jgi:DNA-binding response OmpR family regulator
MRVLVAEDEAALVEILAEGLRAKGIAVDVAFDGAQALERLAVDRYDVLVLDRDLPVVHGDEVCRQVVASDVPTRVLMLTAAGTVEDRVDGLDLGADDYLAKPFVFSELVARIRALGRRTHPVVPPVIEHDDLTVDVARRIVSRGGRELALSGKEFGVLEVLLGAQGALVTSEDLLERVWDVNTDPFTNAVRVTVMRLRRKLGEPPLIDTVPGAGYRIRR